MAARLARAPPDVPAAKGAGAVELDLGEGNGGAAMAAFGETASNDPLRRAAIGTGSGLARTKQHPLLAGAFTMVLDRVKRPFETLAQAHNPLPTRSRLPRGKREGTE